MTSKTLTDLRLEDLHRQSAAVRAEIRRTVKGSVAWSRLRRELGRLRQARWTIRNPLAYQRKLERLRSFEELRRTFLSKEELEIQLRLREGGYTDLAVGPMQPPRPKWANLWGYKVNDRCPRPHCGGWLIENEDHELYCILCTRVAGDG